MILETFLILAALPFVGLTLFFGTKNGYYNSDDYTGDGCAHDVKRYYENTKQRELLLFLLGYSYGCVYSTTSNDGYSIS